MKKTYFLALVLTLILLSCESNSNKGKFEKRIQVLENKILELQEQLGDQKQKSKILFTQLSSETAFSSPVVKFLLEDEVWENIVDVGLSTCSNRCSKTFNLAMKNCAKKQGSRKVDCEKLARKNSEKCQQDCVKSFPIK